MPESIPTQLEFAPLGRRRVLANFAGGDISADGGLMIQREANRIIGLIPRMADAFCDWRNPNAVTHTVTQMIAQRVFGLGQGYGDLNDHNRLRSDPLLGLALGRDDGTPLASAPTLNRLELSTLVDAPRDRYKRIAADTGKLDALLVDIFLESHPEPPDLVYLDVDATDVKIHGRRQEGRFFHGYYDAYCYLPLYVFCGRHLLLCRLRTADRAPGTDAAAEIAPVVERIRRAWPDTRIVLRGDADFGRDQLMAYCEDADGVDFLFGLARNPRLRRRIGSLLERSRQRCLVSGKPSRRYRSFRHETLKGTWSRPRRVVGKAEYLPSNQAGRGPRSNARFVVTSLDRRRVSARQLYELEYCPRGDAENRIFEQLQMLADRTSSRALAANQLRLYFAGFAYVLMAAIRRLGLDRPADAPAQDPTEPRPQCRTIRRRYLKAAVRVRQSTRRVLLEFSSSYPHREELAALIARLARTPAWERAPGV